MNVLMPQLGETVTEGTVSNWHKKVGDKIEADELVFDIETEQRAAAHDVVDELHPARRVGATDPDEGHRDRARCRGRSCSSRG